MDNQHLSKKILSNIQYTNTQSPRRHGHTNANAPTSHCIALPPTINNHILLARPSISNPYPPLPAHSSLSTPFIFSCPTSFISFRLPTALSHTRTYTTLDSVLLFLFLSLSLYIYIPCLWFLSSFQCEYFLSFLYAAAVAAAFLDWIVPFPVSFPVSCSLYI